jgi:hypothetical protein
VRVAVRFGFGVVSVVFKVFNLITDLLSGTTFFSSTLFFAMPFSSACSSSLPTIA